jgi:hypothetical protein
MRSPIQLLPRSPALGLALLLLTVIGPKSSAQITVHIGEGMTVQAYNVDIALAGTIEAAGTLDTRSSTITFTQTDGTGGITLGGGLRVELTDDGEFEGTIINGPVQIEGALQVRVAPNIEIEEGDTFTVLTCTGGCNGTFDAVDAPFNVGISYSANTVTLTALEAFSTPIEGGPSSPERFIVHAPYPNPFAGATTLRLDLETSADVRVEAFDLLGRRVAVVSEGPLPAGSHELRWAAAGLGSGAYVVAARIDNEVVAVWRVTLTR